MEPTAECIVKREVISSDKDGTLEKVHFEPQAKADGTLSDPWELRATGRKCHELKGAFNDVKHDMLHQSAKEWEQNGGDVTITKPDGSTDTVRADWEEMYRAQPGFCIHATRPTFLMNGFGGMRREGIRKLKVRYQNGVRTVLEEVR